MIYLDNAATTFKKPKKVYSAVYECMKKYGGNAGRGGHKASIAAAEKIYSAREKVAEFLGISSPERVVFTFNATYALNMAIKGLIKERCHVIISDVEHNSVLRPINKLKETLGIEYSSFFSGAALLEKEIERHVRPDTKFIVSTLASNVDGREIPLEILSKVAQKKKIKLIVDASQYIGHKPIDISKSKCSALCAPAHKALFGISGLGFAVFSENEEIDTFAEGGSGALSKSLTMPSLLPERLEGGTLPTPAISALSHGIEFIERIGLSEISDRISALSKFGVEMISSVPNMIIYGSNMGIIAFNKKGVASDLIAERLDEKGICVRGGFHCAPMAHTAIGTESEGAVRVSLSYFSTKYELYRLYKALKCIRL